MSTEQLQRESEDDVSFSDVATTSRELQRKGVTVTEEDVEIEEKLVLDPEGKRTRLPHERDEDFDVDSTSISEEDILNTLESHRSASIHQNIRRYWRDVKIMDFKDLDDDKSRHDNLGIIKEEDGTEYVYPCLKKYIVRIDPSDPIIGDEFYIAADRKENAESVKDQIVNADESKIIADKEDYVIESVNIEKGNTRIRKQYFNLMLTITWGMAATLSFASGNSTALAFLQLLTATCWGVVTIGEFYKDDTEEVKEHQMIKKYDIEGQDINPILESYIQDKTTEEYVEFGVRNGTEVTAKAEAINTEWDLSHNGIVPERVVEFMESFGFDNIEDPSYRIKIKPVEAIDDPDNVLISNCGNWYLDLDSTEPVTNYKSNNESA